MAKVKLICEHCGKEFDCFPSGIKRGRKYCSSICYHTAQHENVPKGKDSPNWIPRIIITCKGCGKEIEVNPRQTKATKFCSRSCYDSWIRESSEHCPSWKGGEENKIKKVCVICGKEFRVFPFRANQKHCSRECYISSRRNQVKKTCIICEKEFTVEQRRASTARFCSITCRSAYFVGKNHPCWKEKIQKNCEFCGKVIEILPSRTKIGKGLFCSKECYTLSQQTRVKRTCEWCGNEFETIPCIAEKGHGRFCSSDCHIAWQRRNQTSKVCEICGKKFEVAPSRAETARFCSIKCYRQRPENNPNWRGGKISRTCEICERKFEINQYGIDHGKGKVCSMTCWGIRKSQQSPKARKICPICGQEFEVIPSKASIARFCSLTCKSIGLSGEGNWNWMGGKSFEPYPSTFNETFKRKIRERDEHTCAICGEWGNAVHHIDYDKNNTVPENCVTLCTSCHGTTNYRRNYWQTTLSIVMELVGIV